MILVESCESTTRILYFSELQKTKEGSTCRPCEHKIFECCDPQEVTFGRASWCSVRSWRTRILRSTTGVTTAIQEPPRGPRASLIAFKSPAIPYPTCNTITETMKGDMFVISVGRSAAGAGKK